MVISHSLIRFNASVLFSNIHLLFQHHQVALEAPQVCLVRALLVNRMSLFLSISYFIISKIPFYFLITCFLHFKLKLNILHYLSLILVFNILKCISCLTVLQLSPIWSCNRLLSQILLEHFQQCLRCPLVALAPPLQFSMGFLACL